MELPGGSPTITTAAKFAFEAWIMRAQATGTKAPNWENLSQETREAWIESQQAAAETVAVAMLTDLAIWADTQGDLGAALARAVWRYAREELGYEPPAME